MPSNEYKDANKLTINAYITNDRLENLMVCCFEGGSNYWIKEVIIEKGRGLYDFVYDGNITLKIKVDGDSEIYELDKFKLLKGLSKMTESRIQYKKFKRLINVGEDAIDTDVMLQMALFGEIVYG